MAESTKIWVAVCDAHLETFAFGFKPKDVIFFPCLTLSLEIVHYITDQILPRKTVLLRNYLSSAFNEINNNNNNNKVYLNCKINQLIE